MRPQSNSQYPRPLVINPQTAPHKQTIIILHDRGSNATDFGPALLFTPFNRIRSVSSNSTDTTSTTSPHPRFASSSHYVTLSTLRTAFPHAKFIFPTASLLRASTFTESVINQWFDTYWPLVPPSSSRAGSSITDILDVDRSTFKESQKRRSELPIPGLRDTVGYLHELIQAEIDSVDGDAARVVLGGLGQGCAASLISALLWEGDPLGACVGLCGWLPFAEEIRDAALLKKPEGDDNDNPNPNDNEQQQDDTSTPLQRGINFLRKKLDLPSSLPSRDTTDPGTNPSTATTTTPPPSLVDTIPLFIAHGAEDKTVPITLSRQTNDCLATLGWVDSYHQLQRKEYPGLGHMYSGVMFSDLAEFLSERFSFLP